MDGNFFLLIVCSLGSFVKFDEKTELKQKLETTRVCVSTSSLCFINKVLSIKIDGKSFTIRVVEFFCECDSAPMEESDDEAESEEVRRW